MTKKTFLVYGACLVLAAQAFAVPIMPGVSAPAASEPDPVSPPAAVVAGPLVTPLLGAAFSATLTSWVYSDPLSPTGGLTFVYEVANSAGSADPLGRFTVNGYTGWATDMSFMPGVGTVPTIMDRSPTGDVVGYSFVPPPLGTGALLPGATSTLLVVQTSAPSFTIMTGNVIDGSIAAGPAYAPVPEPTTALVLLVGAGMWLRRRS